MSNGADRPGVVVLPPLLMLLALIAMLLLHIFWSLAIGGRPLTTMLGIVLAVLGILSVAWGRTTMVRGGTNVNPMMPTLAIVTDGPFRFTRNPLYVGVMTLFLGISLVLDTWWGILLLVPVFLILHFGVVLREEAYLDRKFGEPYRSYKASARRYL